MKTLKVVVLVAVCLCGLTVCSIVMDAAAETSQLTSDPATRAEMEKASAQRRAEKKARRAEARSPRRQET